MHSVSHIETPSMPSDQPHKESVKVVVGYAGAGGGGERNVNMRIYILLPGV